MKDTIENDEERLKRAIEEIMALRKNNTFTKISFKLNEIVAETPVVYCEYKDKTYMLGRYEIHVSLDSNEVRIYNLTKTSRRISSSARECPGNTLFRHAF